MNVRILVAAVLLLAACTPAWTAEDSDTWKTLFSDGLLDAEGKTVSPDLLKGKLVGIYFSAHWCPPCRAFTPRLVAFRDKNAAEFEVVFVSFDKSQEEKDKYMAEAKMKWLTVPYKSASGNALAKKYGVRGIPMLVVLSPAGNTVSTTARTEVTKEPDKAIEQWKKAAAEADKK